ncbi:pyridoxamine 5'-phosphate oxidase family protein [Saccharomonospora sp. NPDC046836]|uniref:pyridoxamine 5'-phosphate oxidase family protein n=1 Tax=Saccharomonospora sp. NPDC046836 TaxID=3156921 RepID=UPI0034060B16
MRNEHEIWLTTVRSDGQPQASAVGFLWAGAELLILTDPHSQKIRNLNGNPKVALHLDIDRHSEQGGVVTLEGLAMLDAAPLSSDERTTYAQKYTDEIRAAELTPHDRYGLSVDAITTRVRKEL